MRARRVKRCCKWMDQKSQDNQVDQDSQEGQAGQEMQEGSGVL